MFLKKTIMVLQDWVAGPIFSGVGNGVFPDTLCCVDKHP